MALVCTIQFSVEHKTSSYVAYVFSGRTNFNNENCQLHWFVSVNVGKTKIQKMPVWTKTKISKAIMYRKKKGGLKKGEGFH